MKTQNRQTNLITSWQPQPLLPNPNLLTQEISAARKLLAVLLPLLKEERLSSVGDGFAAKAQARLPRVVGKLVRRYVELDAFVLEHRAEDMPDRCVQFWLRCRARGW